MALLPMIRTRSPQAYYRAPELAPDGTSHGWAIPGNSGTFLFSYVFVNVGENGNAVRPGFASSVPIRWGKSRGFLSLFFPN